MADSRAVPRHVAVIGSGHLARRVRMLARAQGHALHEVVASPGADATSSEFDAIAHALHAPELASVSAVYLVDDRDDRNLEMLIALLPMRASVRVVVSLFNERVAPHLQAAHGNVQVLNPARIAAPAFVEALHTPVEHRLAHRTPHPLDELPLVGGDRLLRFLVLGFVALVALATTWFHLADQLAWLDALYFVVVTVATVGYGDVSLLHSGTASKLAGIALILASTCFIWMIFSLTVDGIIKRRVQLALGRRRYDHSDHVIVCGLGRLGYFVAEGLVRAGERVLVVEQDENSSAIDYFRSLGADVYVGNARLPRVLQDVGVARAKALYSLVDNDYGNLEIGLNARSFAPDLRLVLRIFDESMSARIRDHLDIRLTFSMSALADDHFLRAGLADSLGDSEAAQEA